MDFVARERGMPRADGLGPRVGGERRLRPRLGGVPQLARPQAREARHPHAVIVAYRRRPAAAGRRRRAPPSRCLRTQSATVSAFTPSERAIPARLRPSAPAAACGPCPPAAPARSWSSPRARAPPCRPPRAPGPPVSLACQPPRGRVVAMPPSCGRKVCNVTIDLKNDILGRLRTGMTDSRGRARAGCRL